MSPSSEQAPQASTPRTSSRSRAWTSGIDLFERLPAPYGLVRYGVAPDHPRIKQIIVALYKILQRGDIRLIGNVEVGRDISVAELHEHYDAIVFSTGADTDAPLDIPGVDAPSATAAPTSSPGTTVTPTTRAPGT